MSVADAFCRTKSTSTPLRWVVNSCEIAIEAECATFKIAFIDSNEMLSRVSVSMLVRTVKCAS